MNINQLSYFVSVSQTMSFSRTAAEFYVSRQSVSQAVHAIEGELGVKLISSDSGRIVLTSEGCAFAARAKVTIESYNDLVRDFSVPHGSDRDLQLAVDANYLANHAVHFEAVERYAMSKRGCQVFVKEGVGAECFDSVLRRCADACIVSSMTRAFPGCIAHTLAEGRLSLAISSEDELAKRDHVTIRDLAGRRLILPLGYKFMFYVIAERCHRLGLSFEPSYVINEGKKALEAVAHGFGSAILVADDARGEIDPSVALVPFEEDWMVNRLYLAFRKDSDRKGRIEHFIGALKADPLWGIH